VDQAGHTVATNPPLALQDLLDSWKRMRPEAGASSFRIWSEGVLGRALDPAADTDGDGASNFEEFATGSSPIVPAIAGEANNPLQVTRQTIGGQKLNILAFTRSTTVYGLEMAVESSKDMGSWEEAAYFEGTTRRHGAGFAVEATSESNAKVENIRLTDLSTSSDHRRFYRLRIHAP
jgi:hypothetical protein